MPIRAYTSQGIFGGPRGTPREAAKDADAVLLAVHWSRVDDVLAQAGDLSRQVVISCTLPMNADDTGLVVGHTSSGLVYCGDDRRAKKVAAQLIADVGFDPVDAGALRIARHAEPFTLLIAQLAYEGVGGPALAYRLVRYAAR